MKKIEDVLSNINYEDKEQVLIDSAIENETCSWVK